MELLELYLIAMGLLLAEQLRADGAEAIPDRPVAYQVAVSEHSILCDQCANFSTSHHEHRSGIDPLTGSARSVPIAPFRFAARG